MGKKRNQTHTSSRNRKQITIVVSSSADGSMLPLQVVFQGTINWALPPMNEGKKNCLSNGFHLTYSSIVSLIWKPLRSLLNTSSCPISKVQVDKLALLEKKRWFGWLTFSQFIKAKNLWMDKVEVSKNMCHFHSSKLHLCTSTCWCHPTMSIQTCVQEIISFLDMFKNQKPIRKRWKS